MRDVDAAATRSDARKGDELLGGGEVRRNVLQSGGESERPLRHRGIDERLHVRQLGWCGRAVLESEHSLANPAVPGEEADVRRRAQCRRILAERPGLVLGMQRSQNGGDSLTQEILRERIAGQRGDMGVAIDESGRDNKSARFDDARRGIAGNPGVDAYDLIAADGDIGTHAGRARTVDNRAASDYKIVRRPRCRGRLCFDPNDAKTGDEEPPADDVHDVSARLRFWHYLIPSRGGAEYVVIPGDLRAARSSSSAAQHNAIEVYRGTI
ncbi:MAG: hypothetical protein H7Z74_10080 [Anaerolineae bacterium]|nr:hypothetical protein [Gemmatimonadaceae bacterium]